LGIEN